MTEWLRRYGNTLLRKADDGPLYGGPEKLEVLWPMFFGGLVFAALDIALKPENPVRDVLLVLLVGPGALWAAYILLRWMKSFPRRYRRHKNLLKGGSEEQ